MKKKVVRALTAAGAGLVALAIGLTGGQAIASAFGGDDDGAITREEVAATLPPIEVNEKGQTYGSLVHAASPEESPDLVLVLGDNGKEGYVYASDLDQPDPSSPEEAVRQQANPVKIVIDVYLSDGTTKIDTFTIG